MQAGQAIAIIGGGASGLLTAIQILCQGGHDGPRVYLVEKEETFGFGAAYSTNDPSHLLNTRAGNMSGFPDKPRHFLDWLQANGEGNAVPVASSCFVSRQTYGRYLRSLLGDAMTGANVAGRLQIVPGEAVSLHRNPGGRFYIRLTRGNEIEADGVVLAAGNPPPHPPGVEDDGVLTSQHYIGDPWSSSITEIEPEAGTVLILGTGLTMVDNVLSLARQGHRGQIIALSRRGLLPRRHTATPSTEVLPPQPLTSDLVADLRTIRRSVRETRGRDWRDVVDSLRPITSAYWRSLPLPDQQRFLRHLRPWWEVHRHRIAPEAADKLEALLVSGRLEVRRGRLKRLALRADALLPVSVTWTPKATGTLMQCEVAKIINCTGPGNDPRHSPLSLIQQMLSEGLIQPDVLGLGLTVDDMGRVVNRSGSVEPLIFAIGPVTRGTFWEVTAIPDIRVKAVEVARALLLALKGQERTDLKQADTAAQRIPTSHGLLA